MLHTPQGSRSTVAEYNDKLKKLEQDDAVRTAVLDRLKASDATLDKLKSDMDAMRAKMDDIRAKEAETAADIPTLQVACWEGGGAAPALTLDPELTSMGRG